MPDWTPEEVEAIVSDYFAMWRLDLLGKDFNKAEHNRLLRQLIMRSKSAVEQKHQNISAVLWHLGYPYLQGYKPLPNYQKLLRTVVEGRLATGTWVDKTLNRKVRAAVTAPLPSASLAFEVAPPESKEMEDLVKEEKRKRTKFSPRNYLEIEARNQSLGRAGEEIIFELERIRLAEAGRHDLADQVEHVSKTKGDHLGYDIKSFEPHGQDRLIEVKTTRYGAMTRFFATSNEIEVSDEQKNIYRLYRLFNFEKGPQFFILPGSLRHTCQLQPVNYSAIPHRT